MKKLLIFAAMVLMAGGAMAQDAKKMVRHFIF